MRYVLFATAGHVDHGKTSLIKSLTGTDTDRLPEEKKRGLSIDIGFAYLDFPRIGVRLELIDVPGHERYIKNAVAGLSSVEGLLLVVDAGEGVMPQTVEHVKVAVALGVRRGVAVLTKIDRVDEELLEIAREELREFLRKEDLDFPIVPVSVKEGEGLDELKGRLEEVLMGVDEAKVERPLRVFVDSSFVVRGYGTVLRGSCVEGRVREGDRVVVEPLGVWARVRKLQNHGVFVKEAVAGERVALNLPEVEASAVERGFWVLEPDSYERSSVLLIGSDGHLRPGKLYTFFMGMREVRGRLGSVGEGVYTLRTMGDVVVRRGDRFIVLSPEGRFLGGGEVLHPKPRVLKKRFIKSHLRSLKECFEAYVLLEAGGEGLTPSFLRKLTGRLPSENVLKKEGIRIGERYYSKIFVERLRERLETLLRQEIVKRSYGVERAWLCEKLSVKEELLSFLLSLVRGFVRVGEYIVEEGSEDIYRNPEVKKVIELMGGGFREERELLGAGVSKEVLSLLVRRRLIHRLGDYLLLPDESLKVYIKKLRELGDEFGVKEAKDRLGLSRKYLIPLLEYLDYLGLTRREGNTRRWLR